MKKFLLGLIFSRHELNVVNKKDIHRAVLVVELGHLFISDGIDKIIDKRFRTQVVNLAGATGLDLISYGMEKMGLAEANTAINKKRVVSVAGLARNR